MQVGITLNLDLVRPASAGPADQGAAGRVNDYLNRWFLDATLNGTYPQWLHQQYAEQAGGEFVRSGDLATIRAEVDFLGVNYCTTVFVTALASGAGGPNEVDPVVRRPYPAYLRAAAVPGNQVKRTAKGWKIHPEGLRDMLTWLHEEYGGMPMYITENGMSCLDEVLPDGSVPDPERVDYLRSHFLAAHDAIAHGVNLRGYFVWSLLDNFEWADGYEPRFGLVHVDFAKQERVPKSSAYFLSDVAARNSLTAPIEP